MKKKLWKILQSALLAALSLVLLCNLYVMGAKWLLHRANPTVFGWSWAVVLSGSMEPAVRLDDLIIAKAQDSYRVGDIITFESGSSLTTHRIVGTEAGGFRTKGDANNAPDAAPVPQEAILGRVVLRVPKVGLVVGYLKTPMGMTCMVLLGVLLLQWPYLTEELHRKHQQGGCDECNNN